jgi:hypothetical protein
MCNFLKTAVLGVVVMAAAGTQARAQFPSGDRTANPNVGPPVSPYLNLLRRGSSGAVNYYGLVRPDLEFRGAVRGLQQQMEADRLDQAAAAAGPPVTGHAATFLDTRGYFLNVTPPQRRGPLGPPPGPPAGPQGGAGGGTPSAPRR